MYRFQNLISYVDAQQSLGHDCKRHDYPRLPIQFDFDANTSGARPGARAGGLGGCVCQTITVVEIQSVRFSIHWTTCGEGVPCDSPVFRLPFDCETFVG